MKCKKEKREEKSMKYKIKHEDGFTDVQCRVCGFWLWVGDKPESLREIIHVKSPTLQKGSHHKLIYDDCETESYGCPYSPEEYPLMNVSEKMKMQAKIEDAKLMFMAEQVLKNAHLFKFDESNSDVQKVTL